MKENAHNKIVFFMFFLFQKEKLKKVLYLCYQNIFCRNWEFIAFYIKYMKLHNSKENKGLFYIMKCCTCIRSLYKVLKKLVEEIATYKAVLSLYVKVVLGI